MIKTLKTLGAFGLRWSAALLGVCLFFMLWGKLFRPATPERPRVHDQQEVATAEALRSARIDPAAQPANWVEVDYAGATEAHWFPRGEAPILAGLVQEGALPPVDQRIGPEPLVLQGPDGDGDYGGTLFRIVSPGASDIAHRYSGATLFRWSPQGYPVVPHIAKSWEVRDGNREFIIHLREGMRWSDGHPFTTDDILYYWEYEILDPSVPGLFKSLFTHDGELATLTRIDDYSFSVRFSAPNVVFVERLATNMGLHICNTPRHYLAPYHPTKGDPAKIEAAMEELNMVSPHALYEKLKDWSNPEHPRLWPWVYRRYQANPPHVFVRNPYYFAVDSSGRQLPYIDQIHLAERSPDMSIVAVSSGEVSIFRELPFSQYTLLMSQRDVGDYDLKHWYSYDSTDFLIFPNHNHYQNKDSPEHRRKRELLKDRRFRQALSLALDRDWISRAEFSGLLTPGQLAPTPETAFFEPSLPQAYVQRDLARANALLDEIGLHQRDGEGLRSYADGTRLQLYLDFTGGVNPAIAETVAGHWRQVGLRVVARSRSASLFNVEREGLMQDLIVTRMNGKVNPLIDPKNYVPTEDSDWARGYGRWYSRGGLRSEQDGSGRGSISPPEGSAYRHVMRLFEEAQVATTREQQIERFREILKIAAEEVWTINLGRVPPVLVMVDRDLRNVPSLAVMNWDFLSPANVAPETFFFASKRNTPGVDRTIREALLNPGRMSGEVVVAGAPEGGGLFGVVLRWLLAGGAVLAVILVALRHPFIGRRLLIMVPTMLVVSVIVFTVIQLPPGDFLTSYIHQLESRGEDVDMDQVEELRKLFELDKGVVARYADWMGFSWFLTFDGSDRGLLQGEMGLSMQTLRSVNEVVGDRLILTIAISFLAVLFTWLVALPIGAYSAVKQYTFGDYAATFIGFIGMCIPNFLLALILMYISMRYFDLPISGLFSVQYVSEPDWSWGKVVDLMKHIWVPIVVLGTGSTAWMIRVMRGNLLDELKKPYVTTARAKGVRPLKLIIKYPIRIALNPFISSIGGVFPQLVSGGAIVALILSLPTIGPLLLNALQTEDMYLAGSMLMLLSLLGIVGTLVSDLLLLMLDPRIRMEGGSK